MAIDVWEKELRALRKKPERVAPPERFTPQVNDVWGEELSALRGRKTKPVPLWKKPTRSFMAGVGDTLKTAGYAVDFLGGRGDWAKEAGRAMSKRWEVPDEDPREFEWDNLVDPHWLSTRIPRALPFSLSLVPAALVGAAGAVKVGVPALVAVGVTKATIAKHAFIKTLLGSFGAGAASRPIESALEAGNTYEMALARGDTEEEAREAAKETFRRNLLLAGMDAGQIALAFTPIGKGKAFTRTLARRVATTTAKVAGVGVLEGAEEIIQDVIQRQALGEEVKWDPQMREAAALGAIMGCGLGTGGSVYTVCVERVKRNLPLYQQNQIRAAKEGLTGIEAQRAETLELDKIVETEEGRAAVEEAAKKILSLAEEFDAEHGIPVERVGEMVEVPVEPVAKEVPPAIEPIPEPTPEPTPEPVIEEAPPAPPAPPVPERPEALEPLAREARKFKSVIEFVEKGLPREFYYPKDRDLYGLQTREENNVEVLKRDLKREGTPEQIRNRREMLKASESVVETIKKIRAAGFNTYADFHAQAVQEAKPAPERPPAVGSRETIWEVEKVMPYTTTSAKMRAHPNYRRAKAGDVVAAQKTVRDIVKPELTSEIIRTIKSDDIIVPVIAQEELGRNKLPLAFAAEIANRTGATIETDIVQTVRAFHTAAPAMERLINRPEFEGKVIAGRNYVLVDDHITLGGTLSELANYIRQKGGKVKSVVTLSTAGRETSKLKPSPELLKTIERRFGNVIEKEFGVKTGALTQSEAAYLSKFLSVDKLRDRIAQARGEARRRVVERERVAPPVKESETLLLTPIELKDRIKRGEKIVRGEGYIVKIGGRPTTRARAIKQIQAEKRARDKEIAQAKTKAEKEAKREERLKWLEKIGLIVREKYPFTTKEQRRKLYATKPAIARTLAHNIDWDKLTPEQQGQIELHIHKKKKDIPVEILIDAIERSNLLIPEASIQGLKYEGAIKEHLAKTEARPIMPTATLDNLTIPKKRVGGEGLVSIATKLKADYNLDAFEKALPSYPKELMKLQRDIATEKRKLKVQLGKKEITELQVDGEIAKLNKIVRQTLDKLNMAERITLGGNVVAALRESGHDVNIEFAEGPMNNISGIDKWVADPMTQMHTIDGAPAGLAWKNIMDPAQMLELARDQMTNIYQHKMRQLAVKHKVLHASRWIGGIPKKTKMERMAVGKLLDVITTTEMDMTVDEILALDKVKAITTKRNLIEFIKEIRPLMDDIRHVVNVFRVKYGKEPMGRIDAYLPHMRKTNAWAAIFGKEKKVKDVMEQGSLPDYILPNQPGNPFVKVRKYGLDISEIDMDWFKVFDRYSTTMMKSIFNTIIIHNNKIHAEVLRSKGLVNAASWLDTWTAQSYAGVLGRLDRTIVEISPRVYKALGMYRQMLMRMVFPFNLGWSIITQPSSIILTLARMGPRHLATGFHDWFVTGKDRKKINQLYTYLVKNQDRGSALFQDIAIEVNYSEKGILDNWQNLGSVVLRLFERHLTGWSIAAGYSKHRADGLTGRALDNAAGAEGGFTQSMYNYSMRPLLLQSRSLTATIPFQTFVFQLFNLSKEIAGVTGQKRTVNARLAMAMYVLVGAMLWNEYTEKIAGRRLWQWQSAIPFSGAIWSPFDRDRSPFSYVATYNMFMEAMDRYLNTGNFTPMRRALTQWGTAALRVGGGLKMNRVINAMIASYKGGLYAHDDRLLVAIKEPEEKIRAFILGPWATKRGQEYWNLRDNPGLATRAYNWIVGKQPTSYNAMRRKIIEYMKKTRHRSIAEIRDDAELRNMMAEFNVQARDRFHRSLFVKGIDDVIKDEEYFREMRRRTIDYRDISRWHKLEIRRP